MMADPRMQENMRFTRLWVQSPQCLVIGYWWLLFPVIGDWSVVVTRELAISLYMYILLLNGFWMLLIIDSCYHCHTIFCH